jgi:protein involved in polysaccharide export with SLBB domain
MNRLFLTLTLVSTIVFAPVSMASNLQGGIQYNANAYRLGPGDDLTLTVLPQEKYGAASILVRPDGNITVPGVGDINVAGETLHTATEKVRQLLSEYLLNANITLGLRTPRSATIYLAGAVMRPGSFQMIQDLGQGNVQINNDQLASRLDMVLTNVLANTGGLHPNADLSQVKVTRAHSGEEITLNLWELIRHGKADMDVWLNPGDSVFVPFQKDNFAMTDEQFQLFMRSTVAPKSIPVRVIGHVTAPNVFEIDGTTPFLNTAIAKAGGYLPQATRRVVAVRRFTGENQFTTLFIPADKTDFVLRANDVVYVGENKVYLAGRFMDQVANVMKPFNSAVQIGMGSAQIWGFGGWGGAGRFSN